MILYVGSSAVQEDADMDINADSLILILTQFQNVDIFHFAIMGINAVFDMILIHHLEITHNNTMVIKQIIMSIITLNLTSI